MIIYYIILFYMVRTKSRKTLKMRRRNARKTRKMNKKGGVGMLTPPGSPIQQQGSPNFIDVDTPGSMHLSDLAASPRNSESGYTTGDSASGLQGLNLTQQFNDADSGSFNTEGEDSISSIASAVPGQQGDDAGSFGSLGHGGKRRTRRHKKSRRNKKSRKSRRYRIR
jgi:hypothetical protein